MALTVIEQDYKVTEWVGFYTCYFDTEAAYQLPRLALTFGPILRSLKNNVITPFKSIPG